MMLLKLLIIIFSVQCITTITFPGVIYRNINSEKNSSLVECAFKVLKRSQVSKAVLLYIDDFNAYIEDKLELYNSTLAIFNLQKSSNDLLNSARYNFHLMLIKDVKDFHTIISILYDNYIWNPSGKFLVAYFGNDDVSIIFDESWNKYIININVLQKKEGSINVITYFPFDDEKCIKILQQKLVCTCDNDTIEDYYFNKIIETPNNCQLKVVGNTFPPFVKNPLINDEDAAIGGFEVALVSLITNRLKLKRKNIATVSAFGIKLPNGSYTGVLKLLAEGECDIAYGHLVPNLSNTNDLDTTVYYFMDPYVWHVPAAKQGERWKSLILIYQPTLWISIMVILFCNISAWWIIGLNSNDVYEFKSLIWCALHSWYSLLLGSVKLPFKFKLRLLVILWTYFSLILATLYQSQLVGILLKPEYEHQISTKEELVASSLNIIIINDFVKGFKSSRNPIDLDILKRSVELPYKEYIETKFNFREGYAFISSAVNTKYLMLRNYTLPNGDPEIYVFKNIEFMNAIVMYFRKGYPFLEKFNELILLSYSNGLVAKWLADSTMFIPQIVSDEPEKFEVENLIAAFYLLIIGWIISAIIFISEIVIFKIKVLK